MKRVLCSLSLLLVLIASLAPSIAHAEEPEDAARVAFREGAALIEQTEWAGALSAFERSLAVREHALTLYNIGVCQRYLGRYTLAKRTLARALERNEKNKEMPELFVGQTRTYLTEIEGKLARLVVMLTPKTARVAIEGRPLQASGDENVFIAGVAEPGEATSLGRDHFEILVDPRASVLTFSLDGYDTIEIRKEPKAGSREVVDVSMAEQPAQIRVSANVKQAVVRVDGIDVGLTPVIVTRPPGERIVSITMNGFVPYESKLTLKPGQLFPLDAQLAPERPPITKKWWFWVGAAVALAAVGTGTYFIVRPEPERPNPEAGRLGYLAEVK